MDKRKRPEVLERLGLIGKLESGRHIWLHCASVGEVLVAETLLAKLKPVLSEFKFILSIVTPAGYRLAIRKNLPVEKVIFAPIDWSFFVRNTVKRISPEMLILVETEFWPNLINCVRDSGSRVVVVNGRMSKSTYNFCKALNYKRILNRIDLFLMREQVDYEYILRLGVDRNRVFLTGNIKYDQIVISDGMPQVKKSDFGFVEPDRIFIAGSVGDREEKPVITAYIESVRKFPALKLIIAPRHPNRVPIIERILKNNNISHIKRTLAGNKSLKADALILDTFGELKKVYSIADVVFVGGSLIKRGGQNVIEPASSGKMVLFGPHTEHFKETVNLLKSVGAGIEVRNSGELAEKIVYLLSDLKTTDEKGKAGKNSIISARGATQKNVDMIKNLVKKENVTKRILMVVPGRLGDVIFSLPVLASLKKIYPKSYIAWLVDERYKEILEGNKYLDEIITFPFKKLGESLLNLFKSPAHILKLRGLLKSKKFDLSIDLHGLAKSAFAVFLSGAKKKIASSSTYGMKEFSYLFSKEIPVRDENQHCFERHLEVIKHLGGEPVIEFDINISKEDEKFVDEFLLKTGVKKDFVVMFTGGGWRSRRWFPERFSELANRIIKNYGYDIVFIGGKPAGSPETGIIDRVFENIRSNAYNLSGKFTLKQLCVLLKSSKMFVGNEAGPMHLACALGTPVLAIIGPTNPERTGPFGDRFIIVRKNVTCAPCKQRNCKKLECMKLITVEDVWGAFEKNIDS